MKKKTLIFTGMAALAVILDQITKLIVRSTMELGESIDIIKGFFRITYSLNDGMAFGMAGNARWVFMILTPVLLIGLICYFHFFKKDMGTLGIVSTGMILGGGFSNMIDRIFFYHLDEASTGLFDGRVVDFLDFHGIWSAIFNVADSFVVVGVFLFILDFLLEEAKKKKLPKEGGNPDHGKANGSESENTANGTEKGNAAEENTESGNASENKEDESPKN